MNPSKLILIFLGFGTQWTRKNRRNIFFHQNAVFLTVRRSDRLQQFHARGQLRFPGSETMLFIGDGFAVVQLALESSHNQCRKKLAQHVPLGARRVTGISLTLWYNGKETLPPRSRHRPLFEACVHQFNAFNIEDILNLRYNCENINILPMQVQSRHTNSKERRRYINHKPDSIGCTGIKRHYSVRVTAELAPRDVVRVTRPWFTICPTRALSRFSQGKM